MRCRLEGFSFRCRCCGLIRIEGISTYLRYAEVTSPELRVPSVLSRPRRKLRNAVFSRNAAADVTETGYRSVPTPTRTAS